MPDELQGRKIKGQDWAGGDEAGQASKGQNLGGLGTSTKNWILSQWQWGAKDQF